LQIEAAAAAAKANEKEAERTREKLRKAAAAALAGGEADDADCVVRLSGDDESQGQAGGEQASQQGERAPKPDEHATDEGEGEVFSDWA